MEHIRKLLPTQIGLLHFENCINLSNSDQAILDQYHLFIKEIKYDKLKILNSDVHDNNSLLYLFKNALDCASNQASREAYLDVKNLLFDIVNSFEQIVFYCNKIIISIEIILIDFISFYKCLMQHWEYENAAYAILLLLNNYQTENVNSSLELIAEQPQKIKSTIEKVIFKYTSLEEKFLGCLKKLHKVISPLQTSLPEFSANKKYLISSYEMVKEAIKGRMMYAVKETHYKSWEFHETKKLFFKYYSNLIALYASSKDVKCVFEDLLFNLLSFVHEI